MGLINLSNPGRATLVTGQELAATELPSVGHGLFWYASDNNTIAIEANSSSGYAFVTVFDQNYPSTVTKNVTIYCPSTAPLTISLSTAHAASTSGMQTGSSRSDGVFYELRVVTEANGANPRILATPAGTAVNLNSGTTGHVLVSKVLWGAHSYVYDGTHYILGFKQVGPGKCVYQVGYDQGGQVIGGSSTSDGSAAVASDADAAGADSTDGEAISLVAYVPSLLLENQFGQAFCRCVATNNHATEADLKLFYDWYGKADSMDVVASAHNLGTGAGEQKTTSFNFSVPIPGIKWDQNEDDDYSDAADYDGSPATILRLKWSNDTGTAVTAAVWVLGWEING